MCSRASHLPRTRCAGAADGSVCNPKKSRFAVTPLTKRGASHVDDCCERSAQLREERMRRGPADRLVAIARRLRRFAVAGLLVLACASPAAAGPREQAKRIHDRLVGVPPTEAVLASMATKIGGG